MPRETKPAWWFAVVIALVLIGAPALLAQSDKASPEIEQWLAKADQPFQESFQRDAKKPFDAAFENLRRSFLAALDQRITAAGNVGKLDEVSAWRSERQAFFDASRMLPADDSDLANPKAEVAPIATALKPLRTQFRSQLATLAAGFSAKAGSLFGRYEAALTPYIKQLQDRQRTGDAALLTNKLQAVRANWLAPIPGLESSPAATASPAPPAAPERPALVIKKYPRGDDRKAAEWILTNGGNLDVGSGSEDAKRITKIEDLPKGRFSVIRIRLDNTAKMLGNITDLEALAGLDGVTVVEIKRLPLSDEHLAPLTSLPRLARLVVSTCKLTDDAFGYLALLPNLNSLTVENHPAITGTRVGELAATRIANLNFQGCANVGQVAAQIAKCKSLTDLNLKGTALSDDQLALLTPLDRLVMLNISDTKVTLEGLQNLKTLRSLSGLSWDFTPGKSHEEFAAIAQVVPRLTRFNINNVSGNEADVTALEIFRELSVVELRGKEINDAMITGVVKLKGLKRIHVGYADTLSDTALASLATAKGLNNINIDDAPNYTPNSFLKLTEIRSLKRVEVTKCPQITAAQFAAFQKLRPDVTLVR